MRHVIIAHCLLFLLCCSTSLFSQDIKLPPKAPPAKNVFCAQELAMQRAFQQNPLLRTGHEKAEASLYKYLQKNGMAKKLPPMYVLPVVVHIVHDNGAENIADATVLQGIQDLNDAYANIGYYDPATGVDTKIQFCLARRDPDGNATTGITRNVSPLTDMILENDDITVKDLNRWTPTEYINIWLVREICSSGLGCGVAGYAYFPSSHGMPEDGIMMEAEYFGSTQGASGVQIHEMGHYLGLYHTFQDGCSNGDCLAEGDRVCDTAPDQSTAAVPCGFTANSCSTDTDSGFPTDQNDLIEDYMDYGDFNCWSVFTQGQRERMHWFIENIRPSLLESKACLDPCTSALTASFSSSSMVLNVGGSVNFTNASTNSTSYVWKADGVVFSSAANASFTFNTVGVHEVCLEVGNADPNCSDRFCTTITVTCPVLAGFSASNPYPAPSESVTFTNSSTNATSYIWRVNNNVVGASTNFNYAFSSTGVNTVCLEASNGLCSNSFCQQLFVFANGAGPGECDTSFLKTYGTPFQDERGNAIVEIPQALGGGFLVGGGKGDSAMITRLDYNANIVWTRAFDATPDAADFIWALNFDSDNNVIGSGQTRDEPDFNVECFVFKYNIATNNILWVNELNLNDPAVEIYRSIFEKSPGGNYIVAGDVDENPQNALSDINGMVLEINRNTGANVWQHNYTLGNAESFQKTLLHNGAIYTTGRYNFDASGTARMRPGISKLDLNGVQQWSKLYLKGITSGTTARLYASDMIVDNGLVVLGQGDNTGTTTTNVTPFLFKTDNDGNLLWAMNYDIPGATSEVSTQLLNLPDGYLCLGYYTAGDQDVFLFKTNKQGQLQWSKSYGNTATEDAFDLVYSNGQIYFTGKTKAATAGASFDLYLANIGVDGTATALDSCNLFSDLNMTAAPYVNPYSAQHNLTDLNQTWGQFLNDKAVTETAVQSTTVCFQPCLDSCDIVPNAMFQNATTTCLGDSLLVSLTVCNFGNFDLPMSTPVSFYLGNPTTSNAPLLGTFATTQALAKDSCGTFAYLIAAGPNTTIFVMLNDDGSTPRPFSLTSFEADVKECDYTNNLGSFLLNFTAPLLNLGPDIVSCATGVNVLDAGPGFASYHWQDGSMEQKLTAFLPGTYSVTVTDACGGTQTDMLTITDDPASILDLGPDLLVCDGGSHTFNVPGYVNYQWLPADFLSCTDCANPTTTPTVDITYTLVATMADGCIGVDSVQVSVGPALETFANLTICQGDTATVFGMPVTSAGQFSQTFASQNGCDSIVTVTVNLLPVLESFEDVMLCQGDTVFVFGMPVIAGGQFSQTYTSQNGCDSTATVSVGMLPVLESFEDIVICQGDTTFVFGMPVTTAGQFTQTFTAQTGCDSIVTVSVGLLFPVSTQQNISICQGETVDIFGTPTGTAGTYSNIFTGYNGCDSTHTIVLTVNAVSIALSTTNVTCMTLGSATALASGGTGPYTYLWNNGKATPNIDSLTAGSYTVTVTDANGCASTSTTNIQGALGATVHINVNSSVTENEPSGGGLTAIAIGGTAPYYFEWSNGETTANIDSLPSGTYTVTLTDANNCTSQATAFLFIPACTGGKIWNDMDRDGCQDAGETGIGGVQLMLSGTNVFGMSIADTTISAINGEYIFNGLAPGNYFVKILVPTGMSLSQPLACNNDTDDSDFSTSTFTSGVISLVEGHCCLTIDGGLFDACLNVTTTGEICCDQTLCGPGNDPAPITSVAPATGGGGATQYMWMYSTVGGPMGPNWINIPTAMGPSYDPGPLSQTTYFVRCAKSATCTTWLESNVVVITVGNVAVADILPPGPVCTNDPVTFSAAPNQAGANYTWNFGPWGTPSTSILATPTVSFGQAGVATITLTVLRNGCTSTDVLDITVSNNPTYCGSSITLPGGGGQSALADGQFTVFPNPFSDGLTVAWGEGIESEVSVRVYSVEGRLLHSGHSNDGAMRYEAKLSSLPPGVYLLRLRSEDGQTGVFKLVKE